MIHLRPSIEVQDRIFWHLISHAPTRRGIGALCFLSKFLCDQWTWVRLALAELFGVALILFGTACSGSPSILLAGSTVAFQTNATPAPLSGRWEILPTQMSEFEVENEWKIVRIGFALENRTTGFSSPSINTRGAQLFADPTHHYTITTVRTTGAKIESVNEVRFQSQIPPQVRMRAEVIADVVTSYLFEAKIPKKSTPKFVRIPSYNGDIFLDNLLTWTQAFITSTITPSNASTATRTLTASRTITATQTPTPSYTITVSQTSAMINTMTANGTPPSSNTITATQTSTAGNTPPVARTPTASRVPTATRMPTASNTSPATTSLSLIQMVIPGKAQLTLGGYWWKCGTPITFNQIKMTVNVKSTDRLDNTIIRVQFFPFGEDGIVGAPLLSEPDCGSLNVTLGPEQQKNIQICGLVPHQARSAQLIFTGEVTGVSNIIASPCPR